MLIGDYAAVRLRSGIPISVVRFGLAGNTPDLIADMQEVLYDQPAHEAPKMSSTLITPLAMERLLARITIPEDPSSTTAFSLQPSIRFSHDSVVHATDSESEAGAAPASPGTQPESSSDAAPSAGARDESTSASAAERAAAELDEFLRNGEMARVDVSAALPGESSLASQPAVTAAGNDAPRVRLPLERSMAADLALAGLVGAQAMGRTPGAWLDRDALLSRKPRLSAEPAIKPFVEPLEGRAQNAKRGGNAGGKLSALLSTMGLSGLPAADRRGRHGADRDLQGSERAKAAEIVS